MSQSKIKSIQQNGTWSVMDNGVKKEGNKYEITFENGESGYFYNAPGVPMYYKEGMEKEYEINDKQSIKFKKKESTYVPDPDRQNSIERQCAYIRAVDLLLAGTPKKPAEWQALSLEDELKELTDMGSRIIKGE